MHNPPRGIRNNNPGNIEKGTKWQGLADIQSDARFATFTSPEYGIRAIGRLLRTYQKVHKLKTITEVLNRYAPKHENKTDKYVENVAKWSGFSAEESLDFTSTEVLRKVLPAIIRQENGYNPYSNAQIERAISLI